MENTYLDYMGTVPEYDQQSLLSLRTNVDGNCLRRAETIKEYTEAYSKLEGAEGVLASVTRSLQLAECALVNSEPHNKEPFARQLAELLKAKTKLELAVRIRATLFTALETVELDCAEISFLVLNCRLRCTRGKHFYVPSMQCCYGHTRAYRSLGPCAGSSPLSACKG